MQLPRLNCQEYAAHDSVQRGAISSVQLGEAPSLPPRAVGGGLASQAALGGQRAAMRLQGGLFTGRRHSKKPALEPHGSTLPSQRRLASKTALDRHSQNCNLKGTVHVDRCHSVYTVNVNYR
eukprot:g46897.t1